MSKRDEAQQQFDALLLRLGSLKARLEEAAAAMGAGAGQDVVHRAAAHYALVGVLDFLYSFDDLKKLSAPLNRLNEALVDVVRGVPNGFFATAKAHGRPKQSTRETNIKTLAVLAAEMLIAAKMAVPLSLKHVADAFNQAGARTGRNQDRALTESVVRSWREGVTGRGEDSYTRERLANLKREMRKRGEWPPTEARAKELVKSFARLAATI